jgi:hypothetical protein
MSALPCSQLKQSGIVYRPPWFARSPPVVSDPLYGAIALVYGPAPLPCYKSAELPDGSYWMWLGGPWYPSRYSPLSGMLFFATAWEYWRLLKFQSITKALWISQWGGGPGNGRMDGLTVSVTQNPSCGT